jgi:Sulfotransferase family
MMEIIAGSQILVERLGLVFAGRPDPSANILLAGSGRSGTTWLMNVLASVPGTQKIFEPLHPSTPEVAALTGWVDDGISRVRLRYLRPKGQYPEWEGFLARLLSGRVRTAWTDYSWRSSYLPRRFVIKDIRANLMLGHIHENFKSRIVYLIRHPCAVIHSRLRNGWRADVADLLCQEELVEDYLRPWIGEIEREKDAVGAHAVWWAVENALALHELEGRPHYRETYEDLSLEPYQRVQGLLRWLGLENASISDAAIQQPAWDGSLTPSYQTSSERLASWQKYLAEEEQHRILDWAYRLGILLYDEGALPPTGNCQFDSPWNRSRSQLVDEGPGSIDP